MLKLLLCLGLVIVASVAYASTQHSAAAVPTASPIQAAVPTAASGEQRLELTEQTLTEQLNQRLDGQPLGDTPLGPATLGRITAQLRSGLLVTNGEANVGSTSVPLTVTSRLEVQAGRLLVNIQDASAAGMALPPAARESVQQTIQDQVDEEVDRMHVRVTSVTAEAGKLVVVGTPSS